VHHKKKIRLKKSALTPNKSLCNSKLSPSDHFATNIMSASKQEIEPTPTNGQENDAFIATATAVSSPYITEAQAFGSSGSSNVA
jgi:hypothetical protein